MGVRPARMEAFILTCIFARLTPISDTHLLRRISNWLGQESKMIKNEAGDVIFLSKDGTRKVRFDFSDPSPHTNPHGHIEEFINKKWNKSGPIYPKDIPPY